MMIQQFLPKKVLKYFPFFLAGMVQMIYFMFVILVFILESKQSLLDNLMVSGGTICIIILYWCLWKTSRCDPGFAEWNIQQDRQENQRSCITCGIPKPERTHHCSKCKKCVLNMDHHCVWTANCIGLYNRKSFNLILFWGSLGMIFATTLGLNNIQICYQDFKGFMDVSDHLNSFRCGITVLIICSQSFNAIGLIYFFLTNILLVINNSTTIEELREKTVSSRLNSGHNQVVDGNVYDLGPYYNFTFYFGTNPLLWFFPVGKPRGNGYNWDKRANNVQLVNLE